MTFELYPHVEATESEMCIWGYNSKVNTVVYVVRVRECIAFENFEDIL
jgi:hypothetical protein